MMEPTTSALLGLQDVKVRFGGVLAVDQVTFALGTAETIALIGPNGAGKSTVLNALSGFVPVESGEMVLEGESISRLSATERARAGLGRTFQTPRLFDGLTVRENLEVARKNRTRTDSVLSLDDVAEFSGARELLEKRSDHLVAGERRFAELARALMLSPKVLLLDEPTTGLRSSEIHELGEILVRLRSELGLACIVVAHDMRIVYQCCSNVIVMDAGRVLASGRPVEIRRNPEVIMAYFGTSAHQVDAAYGHV